MEGVVIKSTGDLYNVKINNNTYFKVFEKNKTLYAYSKLNISGKFFEPLELENFPFDCQDITLFVTMSFLS